MDVDRTSFWPKLPLILNAISEAKFISIDLEMSGITMNTLGSRPNPSLQQIYQDAKAAAETFAILQFGLTCIRWDPEKEAYVTKAFNLPVHPGFLGGDSASKQLARTVDRHVGFSSKTIAFLQENGFSFSDVFNKGIPYLSTTEAAQKDIMDFAKNMDQNEDYIDVNQLSPQTREFYSDVQAQLRVWTSKWIYEADIKPLRIENRHGGRLNNLQKRIIHQIVETDFNNCRAYSRAGSAYMEVMELEAKDLPAAGRVKAERKQAVVKQTGVRFLWDAISGRLFADKIDPDLIVGEDPVKIIQLKRDLKEYERQLRNRGPILIGHNILWDLCFLHSTFVGPLPEKVESFRNIVKERLPRIVDTKYFFMRGGHEMLPDYNLAEGYAAIKNEKHPALEPDPVFSYPTPRPHQAGYDSYMTAVVFIKKSYQLYRAKKSLEFIADEDSPEPIASSRSSSNLTKPLLAPHSLNSSSLAAQASRRFQAGPLANMVSRPIRSGSLLDDDNNDQPGASLAGYAVLKPEILPPDMMPVPSSTLETELEDFSTDLTVPSTQDTMLVGPAKVPAWESTFWKRYGNKSRVGPFGRMFYTGGTG